MQIGERARNRGLGAFGDAFGAFLQLAERARHCRGGVLARFVDEAGDLLAVVHHRLREDEALGFDRLHRMVGDAADFAGEFLALAGQRHDQPVRLVVEQAGHFAEPLGGRGVELIGLADDVARNLGAGADQEALGFAGAAADRLACSRGALGDEIGGGRGRPADCLARGSDRLADRIARSRGSPADGFVGCRGALGDCGTGRCGAPTERVAGRRGASAERVTGRSRAAGYCRTHRRGALGDGFVRRCRALAERLVGRRRAFADRVAESYGAAVQAFHCGQTCRRALAERVGRIGGELDQGPLGVAGVDLDRFGQLRDAGAEQIAGGAAAHFQLLGNRLGAADEQMLELADAAVERIGNLDGAGAQRLVDIGNTRADRVGQICRPRIDQRGDVGDALVERGDHLLAALGKGLGDVHDAAGQRIGQRLAAAIERFLEARQPLVERGGDLAGFRGDAIVEALDVTAHRFGDVLSARAKPFDELGAVGLHGTVELGEVPGDEVAERRGVARNLLAELGAGMVEYLLERGKPRRQHVLHGVAARGNGVDELLDALAQRVGHAGAARSQRLGDALAGLLELFGDIAAAQAEVENERLAGSLERRVDLVGARRDRFGELARCIDDGVAQLLRASGNEIGDLLGAADHQVDDRQRFLGEAFGDLIEPRRHHVLEAGHDLGKILADVIGLEVQIRGELIARRRDRARGLLAGVFQPHQEIVAAHAELLDHGVADLTQRQGDVLALLGERMGDALRGLVDLLADQIADGGKVLGQVDMDVVDGGTHLLGLPDQRVALVGEVLEQAADANLVVAVGALERRDFILHQRFELAGARQRPLDAVAHGRDLAADRLADGDDGIPRHAFGLGEPHRDLRHRLRDQAQFLGAPGHVGDAEEEDDGQQRRGAKSDHGRGRRMARAKRRVEIGQIGPRQGETADNPGSGKHRGDEIGGPGRAVLQGLEDVADRLLIVIGGAKRLRLGGARARGADVVEIDGLFERGRRRFGLRHGVVGTRGRSRAVVRRCRLPLLVVPDVEGFLDRRQGCFRRIHRLFRVIRHRSSPRVLRLTRTARKTQAAPRARDRHDPRRALSGSPALKS